LGLLNSFCIVTWLFLHWSLLLLHCYLGLFALLLGLLVLLFNSSRVVVTQFVVLLLVFLVLLFIFLALLFGSFYCCSTFFILLLQLSCCYLVPLIFVWLFQAWAPLVPMCATCFLLCCHSAFLVII
jgi:hypothetical protein